MNIENKALISELLSVTVHDNGKFEFNKSRLYADAPNYDQGTFVNSTLLESDADITFWNLTPEYEYISNQMALEALDGGVICECYSDGQQLIVTLEWESQAIKLGYLGAHPCNSKRFPQAGYLALALLKEKLKDKPVELRNAKKSLFDAIGKVCFPSSDNAVTKVKKIFESDLSKHDKKGTFPLKGAPIQQGDRFFMNGDEYVFSAYGVARVNGEFYGDLILDTAISFEPNGGCYILRISAHCNSAKRTEAIETIDTLKPRDSYPASALGPVIKVLDKHYDDFDLVFNLNTAALSVVHFNRPDLTYRESWNEASMLIATVLQGHGLDGLTMEKRYL